MPWDSSPIDGDIRDQVMARLRRIEGQVRGLQNMLETDRGCEEIVLQLAAVKAAVVNVAMTILGSEMARCIGLDRGAGTDLEPALERFMKAFKKFS